MFPEPGMDGEELSMWELAGLSEPLPLWDLTQRVPPGALRSVQWEGLFCTVTGNVSVLLTPFRQLGRFCLVQVSMSHYFPPT